MAYEQGEEKTAGGKNYQGKPLNVTDSHNNSGLTSDAGRLEDRD